MEISLSFVVKITDMESILSKQTIKSRKVELKNFLDSKPYNYTLNESEKLSVYYLKNSTQ